MPMVQCFQCGKSVFKKPYLIRRADKSFCSVACRSIYYNKGGSDHPNWKGGRYIHKKYVMVKMHGHPEADAHGYVYEHRVVAEKKLGRRLKPGEKVHHVDGNKENNSPENVMVFKSHSEHMKYETRNMGEGKYTHLRCDHCGKGFDRLYSQMKGKNQYCSKECKHAAYVPPVRTLVEVICPQCGKSFLRPQKRVKENTCCSHTCATTFRYSKT